MINEEQLEQLTFIAYDGNHDESIEALLEKLA